MAARTARKRKSAPTPMARARTVPKQYLMRGADEIPEHWEAASCDDVHGGLLRAITALGKLSIEARNTTEFRRLRHAEKACKRALEHLIGGFSRSYMEPKAERWKLLVGAAARKPVSGAVENNPGYRSSE